jgi:hypothetical protein
MRLIVHATVAALMAGTAGGGAKADPYRWCSAEVGQSGSSNCYFLTLEQCRAAASGAGMFCVPNNFYTGPDRADTPRARVKRRN